MKRTRMDEQFSKSEAEADGYIRAEGYIRQKQTPASDSGSNIPKLLRIFQNPSALKTSLENWQYRQRWAGLSRQVVRQTLRSSNPWRKKRGWVHPSGGSAARPVLFFNASSRIGAVSLNAAFSFLTSSSLALSGVPVAHFACKSGMSRCIMGTNKDNPYQKMPCQGCTALSSRLFMNALSFPFTYQEPSRLADITLGMNISELGELEYPATGINASNQNVGIPLGKLVIPGLRWVLRKHDLDDDEPTRFLMREFILSAYHIAREFERSLEQIDPQSVVVFNGVMYPEAVARWVAQQRCLRVITHEVGFRKFSAFFTNGDATAYPIEIPAEYQLSEAQNARLDAYLGQRFQGEFTMAGIRFWPEIRQLDQAFLDKAAAFRQIVPVFTNVIYDTSQIHANVIFPHMFAWLDQVLENIRAHPETLFVIRAHPDEMRPGTAKQSRQTVLQWIENNNVRSLPNVVYIDSQEYISSYELIQRSKFVIVYNSSIGLEAALLGKPVLCGGKARYIDNGIVYFPNNQTAYHRLTEQFIETEDIAQPEEFRINARRFFYYQLYKASLPFDQYLEPGRRPGFVQLKKVHWSQLLPQNDLTMQVLEEGIINDEPFLMPESLNITQQI